MQSAQLVDNKVLTHPIEKVSEQIKPNSLGVRLRMLNRVLNRPSVIKLAAAQSKLMKYVLVHYEFTQEELLP